MHNVTLDRLLIDAHATNGAGKTAFRNGVALGDVMRGRKVLHVTAGNPVERSSNFYNEIFSELPRTSKLLDHARQILLTSARTWLPSANGGSRSWMMLG